MGFYDQYIGEIDCSPGDKVLIYKNELDINQEIKQSNIGIIESINQYIDSDWTAFDFIKYDVVINLNGDKIRIKDEQDKPFFRKYEFITLKDLGKVKNNTFLCESLMD